MKIHLSLPFPPSVNHYWRHARGRHYISSEGKAFRTEVWARVLRERSGRNPISGPLSLTVAAQPPDFAYRDLDNIFKALFDSLKHARVYVDDYQIISLCSDWLAPADYARVWVTIEEVPPPDWWLKRAAGTLKRRERLERAAATDKNRQRRSTR